VNEVARARGCDAGSGTAWSERGEASLRALPLDQYRIVYFATHGLLPVDCIANRSLAWCCRAGGRCFQYRRGGLLELRNCSPKLNADLIVLSACNTAAAGGGRFWRRALEGLADAFFNAGARAVLASHWMPPPRRPIDDGVFQRYWARSHARLAEALRHRTDLTRAPQPRILLIGRHSR